MTPSADTTILGNQEFPTTTLLFLPMNRRRAGDAHLRLRLRARDQARGAVLHDPGERQSPGDSPL
jgi:hypothetical protein